MSIYGGQKRFHTCTLDRAYFPCFSQVSYMTYQTYFVTNGHACLRSKPSRPRWTSTAAMVIGQVSGGTKNALRPFYCPFGLTSLFPFSPFPFSFFSLLFITTRDAFFYGDFIIYFTCGFLFENQLAPLSFSTRTQPIGVS